MKNGGCLRSFEKWWLCQVVQVVSAGDQDVSPGLYRIEVTVGPGGSVRILNAPVPPAFRESVRYGEQNLYTRAKELVGDRDPRSHEFSIQLRAIDADKARGGLGLAVLTLPNLNGRVSVPHCG